MRPRRPAHKLIKISQNGCFHLIPLISSNSALFASNADSQPLSHQSLPHSFPCDGGGSVSLADPLPTRHSLCAALSPVFATHPKNRRLTPLFATLPRTGSRKSIICHTYDTPGGFVPLPLKFRTCSTAESQARGVACLRPPVTSYESPLARHQSLPFVLLRALSCGATIGPERRKCWETKPLPSVSKRRRADSGFGKGSSPRPVNGSGSRQGRDLRSQVVPGNIVLCRGAACCARPNDGDRRVTRVEFVVAGL
jgi:hypothetical protein